MTALADIALEFCRECLGWEDSLQVLEHPVTFQMYVCKTADSYIAAEADGFCYTDLNAIMAAVQVWCRSSRLSFKQHHELQAGLAFQVQQWLDGLAGIDCLCQALLAACVEANRKLKQV